MIIASIEFNNVPKGSDKSQMELVIHGKVLPENGSLIAQIPPDNHQQ